MELVQQSLEPLRVVVYTDAAGIGGAEISLGHLVAHVSSKINVTVLGTSQSVVETIAAQRPQATKVVLPKGLRGAVAHLRTLLKLRPDIVHINLCTPWAGTTGLAAALMLPDARVVRVDQLPLRTTDLLVLLRVRALSLRVDAHVAVGKESARRMEDFYALGRGSVVSIPNGVPNVGEPQPPPNRSNGQLVVGSVGRIDPMKAHDVLLRAIAQVEGVQAVILGEGAYRPELEQLADKLGVKERVDLRGWVDNPRTYLPEFDIIVQPSRSEGFPLAVVEAMLAARPVVATRVGSVAEAVIDGETGVLVDKDDADELATALRHLRDNPELRLRFGQRGREVAASFTAQQMAASYEQLWTKAVATPRSPRLLVPRPRD